MDYLTTIEAGEALGVCNRYVARMCADGRIPGAVLRGRMWLIPAAGLLAFSRGRQPRGNPNWRRRKQERENPG